MTDEREREERERERDRERETTTSTGYVWTTRLGSRSSGVIPEVFWSALWVYKEIKQHNQFYPDNKIKTDLQRKFRVFLIGLENGT